jgi:hypothetical protein
MPVLVLWMVTISIKALPQNGIIVMGNEANGISAAIENTSTIVFPYRVLG